VSIPTDPIDDDDIPEFDMSDARPARHFQRAAEQASQRSGRRIVAIDADIAADFPDASHVNNALRELLRLRKIGLA
jgi:hypothetical protein